MSPSVIATTGPLTARLAVELLDKVYGDRVRSVELAPSDEQTQAPTDLPAIRVKVRGSERTEANTGHHFADAVVIVYSDDSRPFGLSREDFASGTGTVHQRFTQLPSGDLGRVIVGERKSRRLQGGINAEVIDWNIRDAVPYLPVLPAGAAPAHAVAAVAQGVALAISRPLHQSPGLAAEIGRGSGRQNVPPIRAVLLSHELHEVEPEPSHSAPGHLVQVRMMSLSLLVHPVNGACSWAEAESRAMAAIDAYEGRMAERLGRVMSVMVDGSERTSRGMKIGVRLFTACLSPEATGGLVRPPYDLHIPA